MGTGVFRLIPLGPTQLITSIETNYFYVPNKPVELQEDITHKM